MTPSKLTLFPPTQRLPNPTRQPHRTTLLCYPALHCHTAHPGRGFLGDMRAFPHLQDQGSGGSPRSRPAVRGGRLPTSWEGRPALGGAAVSRGGLGRDISGRRPSGRSGRAARGPRAQAGVTGGGGRRRATWRARTRCGRPGTRAWGSERLASPPRGDAGPAQAVGTEPRPPSSAGDSQRAVRPRARGFRRPIRAT